MANWKKVLVSGSAIEVRNITASGLPESSGGSDKIVVIDTTTGQLAYTASSAGGGGIFVSQNGGAYYNTENSLNVTGSTLQPAPTEDYDETRASSYANSNYALIVSESAYFNNHNVGHPNSLAWGSNLDGSIFNAYNSTTDVSEILRTLVGIISSSHPSAVANPTPNSESFFGANVEPDGDNNPNTTISSDFNDARIPTNYTDTTIQYLETKGFNDGAGDTIFGNVSHTKYYQTNNNFGIQLDSLSGAGATYFDAGLKDTAFTVFAIASQSFSDNQTDTTPDANSTFTTKSLFTYTQTGTGTSNGITVQTINTENPTVIPPVYQEAKFANVSLIENRKYKASGEDFTNVSSSGYYKYHDIKVGIATGSTNIADVIGGSLSSATPVNSATNTYFITPIDTSDFSSNSITISTGTNDFLTCNSRSLSGAPYMKGGIFQVNNFTASGMFDPLFWGGNSNIADITFSDNISTVFNYTVSDLRSRVNGGVITSGYQNIYDSTLTTERVAPSTPTISDKVLYDNTSVLIGRTLNDSDSNYRSNVEEDNTPTNTTWTCTMTVRDWNDSTTTDNITPSYHTAGTFNQPASSGSMQVFYSNDGEEKRRDGDTIRTSDANDEWFGGESFRRPIEATSDLASSNAWDSGSRLTLGDGGDLQVKPGYLVNPESANGYWYPTTGYSTTDYKWYLREFDTGETGTAQNLVITLNSTTDLVPFATTTTGKIAIGVVLEYQLNNLDGNNPYIFDVGNGLTANGGDNAFNVNNGVSGGDTQYNPFTNTVDIKSNWTNASDSGTVITLNLKAANDQIINSSNSKVYLLIRYTGTPSNTLESIAVTTT